MTHCDDFIVFFVQKHGVTVYAGMIDRIGPKDPTCSDQIAFIATAHNPICLQMIAAVLQGGPSGRNKNTGIFIIDQFFGGGDITIFGDDVALAKQRHFFRLFIVKHRITRESGVFSYELYLII